MVKKRTSVKKRIKNGHLRRKMLKETKKAFEDDFFLKKHNEQELKLRRKGINERKKELNRELKNIEKKLKE